MINGVNNVHTRLGTVLAHSKHCVSGRDSLVGDWGLGIFQAEGTAGAKALRKEWAFAAEDHKEASTGGDGQRAVARRGGSQQGPGLQGRMGHGEGLGLPWVRSEAPGVLPGFAIISNSLLSLLPLLWGKMSPSLSSPSRLQSSCPPDCVFPTGLPPPTSWGAS